VPSDPIPEPNSDAPAISGWSRLSGHALVYIGSTALSALAPFLILPFLTRWLGPAEFGIVASFLALTNLTLLFVGFSTHGLINVVFYRDGAAAMPPQVGATFGILALTSVPVIVLLYVLARPIEHLIGVSPAWLWTVWLAACGQFAMLIGLAVWQTLRQPFRFAAGQLGFSVLTAGGSVILIGFAGMGWEGRALGQAAGAGLMMLATIVALSATRKVDWNARHWPMRAALKFGLGLLPHSVGAVAMTSIDRFALSATVDTVATGHYFAALQIASITVASAAAFNTAWSPWLYERLARGDDASKRQVVWATYAVGALLLAGAAAIAVMAPWIMRTVAGPGFDEGAMLLRYLAPAAAFSGMYYLVNGYAFYTGRTGTLSTITIATAIVQVALTLVLAHVDGARGVALATLVSAIVCWAATGIVAHRIVPMPWLLGRTLPAGDMR